jgi:hypothetical protein
MGFHIPLSDGGKGAVAEEDYLGYHLREYQLAPDLAMLIKQGIIIAAVISDDSISAMDVYVVQ